MIGDIIIGVILFGAFFRAAREYEKNGFAWGAIGVASFFVTWIAVPMLVAIILSLIGIGDSTIAGWFPLSGLIGFAAAVATVIWVYNKLMDRAIDQQAALDARTSSVRG